MSHAVLALCLGLALSLPTAAAGAEMAVRPDPAAYPVEAVWRGAARQPDFAGRDRAFARFRSALRDGLRRGVNYAGHYALVQIGCGTGCSTVIVTDAKTGQPFAFPRGGEDAFSLALRFAPDSRLILAQWADMAGDRCFIEAFDFAGGRFTALSKTPVGGRDACFEDMAQHLR